MALLASPWMMHLSQQVAGAAVTSLWEGILLAFMVGLCIRLSTRISANIRFLLWIVTFILLLIIPFIHFGTLTLAHAKSSLFMRLAIGWSFVIAVLWISASAFRLGQVLLQACDLRKIWKRTTPFAGPFSLNVQLAMKLRKVQICISSDVDRPSIIGFFAAKVLLPSWLVERISESELEHIILHELEHLRRRDDWLNLLQKLSLVVFPLNPALLWIDRRLCLEREMACDDGVLASTGSPRSYATCLANLAEYGVLQRSGSLSLGAVERKSQLAQRLYRILRREDQARPWKQAAFSATVGLLLIAGAIGVARCPLLISFDAVPARNASASVLSSPISDEINRDSNFSLAAHATMVKASIPARNTYPILKPAAQFHRIAKKTFPHPRRNLPHPQWVVLTSQSIAKQEQQQMILTVIHDSIFSLSYVHVPIGTDWLLIQL